MTYPAVVIDTSPFFEKGFIWVRVDEFYHGKKTRDLSENPKEIEDTEDPNRKGSRLVTPARIFSPLGGGRNYGIFFLPQVNERGLVTFIRGDHKKAIWLGSMFEGKWKDDEYATEYVNVPSDDMTKEGEDSDGSLAGESNMEATDPFGTNIIIRTKRTISDGTADNINWQKRPTSNIISIGEEGIKIKHFNKDDGYNESIPEKYKNIEITTDGIKIEIINVADSKAATMEIKEDSFDITVTGDINLTASDNGKIIIVGDSEIDLNGTSKRFVTYGELNTALQLLITTLNTHLHIDPLSGSTGGPVIPLNLDISLSKTTTIKTGG